MKKRTCLIFSVCAFFGAGIVALDAAESGAAAGQQSGFLLEQELEKTRTMLVQEKLSSNEKRIMFFRLAKLLHLSGDIEGAAAAWLQAAYAEEHRRDDTALLESAACYIAIGEWDKADANIKLAMITVRDNKPVLLRAQYLAAQIEAFRNGNETILIALLEDPDYEAAKPALYWSLWKIGGKDTYRTKLLTEYPASPETQSLLAETGAKSKVFEAAAPQWFLPPGRENLVLETPQLAPVQSGPESPKEPLLQTGVFTSKTNADAQASRLKRAGFNAEVTKRSVGTSEVWSVTVNSGANIQRTIISLKEAGFDAFPLY